MKLWNYFPNSYIFSISTSSVEMENIWNSHCSTSSTTLGAVSVPNFSCSGGCIWWHLLWFLFVLMTSYVEHLFKCVCHLHIFFCKIPVQTVCPFLNWVILGYSFYWVVGTLYISWIPVLCRIYVFQRFFTPAIAYLFNF